MLGWLVGPTNSCGLLLLLKDFFIIMLPGVRPISNQLYFSKLFFTAPGSTFLISHLFLKRYKIIITMKHVKYM